MENSSRKEAEELINSTENARAFNEEELSKQTENAHAFNEWYDSTITERETKKKSLKNRSFMPLELGCHSPASLASRYGENKSTL